MSAAFDRLCRALSGLPGLGRRSAERMATGIALDRALLQEISGALEMAARTLANCPRCGNLTDRGEALCKSCADPKRNDRLLCVVETLDELRVLQRMPGFDGRYFCLLGRLSPVRGEEVPDDRIRLLVARVRDEAVAEVVLATGADAEGEATFAYVRERLAGLPCRVSRLAAGIPSGSGLAHIDPVTLSRALLERRVVDPPPSGYRENP